MKLLTISQSLPLLLLPGVALAQFGPQESFSPTLGNGLTVHDVDDDGDLDLVQSTSTDIRWLEQIDAGTYGAPQTLVPGLGNPRGLRWADLSGDGKLDLVWADETDDEVAWAEAGSGTQFGPKQNIGAGNGGWDVIAADLDGDGDVDVVGAYRYADLVEFYENLGGGTFAAGVSIATSTQHDGPQALDLADLNGDGNLDLLVASRTDDTVAWFPGDGLGGFGGQNVISTGQDSPRDVVAGDLDGDGLLDVVACSYNDDTVAWYANLGGGNFGNQNILDLTADGAGGVAIADVNLDGIPDVACASFATSGAGHMRWYPNTEFSGSSGFFLAPVLMQGTGSTGEAVVVADLDGDTDNDMASNRGVWNRNETLIGTTYCTSEMNSTGAVGTLKVAGSTLASLNRLSLTAGDLPASQFGYFLVSNLAGNTPMAGGSQGTLCLSLPIGRYNGPGQILFSGFVQEFRLVLDLPNTPTNTGFTSVQPGQTFRFQCWYRDSVNGSLTSNFTDAVAVTFD